MNAAAQGDGGETGQAALIEALAAAPASAPGVLAVDLDALRRNYAALRAASVPAECAAVVKADGYGLGATEIVPALAAAGCRTFFVATFAEAMALRPVLTEAAIYVLDGLLPGSAGDFAQHRLQPVLGSLDEVEEWAQICRQRETPLPAALHVDTGMNRLGLTAPEQQSFLEAGMSARISLSLLMSHLACADTPEHPKNAQQRAQFAAFAAHLPGVRRSLANSAATLTGGDFAFDLVRPGIALYGGNPFAAQGNPMEPVVRLFGRIARIGEAEAGETIGYGAALTLKRRTRYATVTAGYADGYFRLLGSNDMHSGATAWLGGHPLPILGRVSMDLIMFDITSLPDGLAQRGDLVELLGARFTVDDAAALAGTIGYEVLTSLGSRYHRIYLSGTRAEPAATGAT